VDVIARWIDVVTRPEDEVPLDEAALLISAVANPALDIATQLSRMDDLAARVDEPTSDAVCDLLFVELGLCGARHGYDDPRNSYLDQVLDRGLGIPISLSVLLIEVARRRGVRLEGVGMPGHFLVRDPASPFELIDAFGGGQKLDRTDCERLALSAAGGTGRLTPEMLAPVGPHAVLTRMLANLDGSFERREDRQSLRWVSELRLHLPSAALGDRTQLASRLAALGRFDSAATALEDATALAPSKQVAERMLGQATNLRARLN
jgi:regulator of sirC expression with transglutaminase-like and TPR domain